VIVCYFAAVAFMRRDDVILSGAKNLRENGDCPAFSLPVVSPALSFPRKRESRTNGTN